MGENVLTKFQKIVASVLKVGKVLVPMLRGLGEALPEVKKWFQTIDEQVRIGGSKFDGFLDRNRDTIIEMREVYRDMTTCGQEGVKLCDKLLAAAVDDTVTPEEAEGIAAQLEVVAEATANIVKNNDALIPKLESMK